MKLVAVEKLYITKSVHTLDRQNKYKNVAKTLV